MDLTPRLFLCARCYLQVVICTYCDRGNIYCSRSCAVDARKQSIREAGIRYQKSLKGRLKHALRQRRYMDKIRDLKKKMTHQGSNETAQNALLPSVKNKTEATKEKQVNSSPTCSLCHIKVSPLFRARFLRYGTSKKTHVLVSCLRPP